MITRASTATTGNQKNLGKGAKQILTGLRTSVRYWKAESGNHMQSSVNSRHLPKEKRTSEHFMGIT
jgi:hypothetical protein